MYRSFLQYDYYNVVRITIIVPDTANGNTREYVNAFCHDWKLLGARKYIGFQQHALASPRPFSLLTTIIIPCRRWRRH